MIPHPAPWADYRATAPSARAPADASPSLEARLLRADPASHDVEAARRALAGTMGAHFLLAEFRREVFMPAEDEGRLQVEDW